MSRVIQIGMVVSAMAACALVACGGEQPGASAGAQRCEVGEQCSEDGKTCSSDGQRCTCMWGNLQCEDEACPQQVRVGESCSDTSLRCGGGFESAGAQCVGPEMKWVWCLVDRTVGTVYQGCPQDEPTVGQPCCLTPAQLTCSFNNTTYKCVDFHWSKQ